MNYERMKKLSAKLEDLLKYPCIGLVVWHDELAIVTKELAELTGWHVEN